MTGSSPATTPVRSTTTRTDAPSPGIPGPRVSEQGDRVVLEFPGIADVGLAARLVREAFTHPAVRADRPILVCLPRGESDVLAEVRPHVDAARTRVAGVTCLVEGRVRALPAPAPRPRTRG